MVVPTANLSADSSADTRGGVTAAPCPTYPPQPQPVVLKTNTVCHKALNPRGLGTASPTKRRPPFRFENLLTKWWGVLVRCPAPWPGIWRDQGGRARVRGPALLKSSVYVKSETALAPEFDDLVEVGDGILPPQQRADQHPVKAGLHPVVMHIALGKMM